VIVRKRFRLTYPPGLLDKPILHTLIRRFDILTNIRSAQVSDTEAWLIVDVEGEESEVDSGLAWAESQGLQVTAEEATT
jgi:hypothetical protein